MRFDLVALLACVLVASSLVFLNSRSAEVTGTSYEAPPSCSPTLVDPRTIRYKSEHWFYSSLRAGPVHYFFPPPRIYGNSSLLLCDGNASEPRLWEYCLPTTGRRDAEFCTGRDRMDLLVPMTDSTRCFSSMLHMILVDVYDEMASMDLDPALVFSSREDTIQESAISSLVDHIKIGFSNSTMDRMRILQLLLTQKGYHVFHLDTWHVCISPTHPLASNLYDANVGLFSSASNVPALNLYEIHPPESSAGYADEEKSNLALINDNLKLFSQATISGMTYNTISTPRVFQYHEYGGKP